jgi:phage shock protein A
MSEARIEELKKQIAELEARWPAHSVPPAMLQQLEDLEEELEEELKKVGAEQEDAESRGSGDAQRGGSA